VMMRGSISWKYCPFNVWTAAAISSFIFPVKERDKRVVKLWPAGALEDFLERPLIRFR
jgi:hypothetical protein